MADLPTRAELFARARAAALAIPGTRIAAKEIDRPGSDANLLVASMSLLGEEIVARLAEQLAGVFEDTATGTRLDRVVFDRKGLPRLPAAPAVGTFSVTRPTFAAGAGTIIGGLPGSSPAPTRIVNQAGIVYVVTQSVSFGALDLGPRSLPVQAELAGLASEVNADQAWSFLTPPFDGSLVITNSQATAGAADQETDDRYRARAKAFFPTLRRGTLGAIEFGLRSTPGVDAVAVSEVINQTLQLPGTIVRAFILDALGNANAALAARAQEVLLEYRAFGVPVLIESGTPIYTNIVFSGITFDSTLVNDTIAAQNAIVTAVVATLDTQQPGQTLERASIIAAAKSVRGARVPNSALVEPAADLVPATPDLVFRTRRELVSFA